MAVGRHRIGQGNNVFIFPGVGLGLWVGTRRGASPTRCSSMRPRRVARQVTGADLEAGAVYPDLTRIRDCSHAVACAIIRRAVADGLIEGSVDHDLEGIVTRAMWFPKYLAIRHEPLPGVVSAP